MVASIPALFGPYRLIQALGPGHSVFLAVGPGPGGECVVRRVPSDRRNDSEFLSRFRRAAHLSRRLAHDGLVAVHDVGEVDGEPYLTEEFVEGHDLADVLQRCAAETRRVPVAAALHIGCAIGRALTFLHEFDGLGLVHRRLQPSQVRLGYQGEVRLLDLASGRAAGAEGAFRLASLAEELPYLAPEQLGDGPVDRRADIYALGVLLWETLTGSPFLATVEGGQAGLLRVPRDRAIELIRAHQPPAPSLFNPEVRADLDAVVMRALAKAPEERFSLAADLERALLPMTGESGREATARLLSRLFDASRERDQRAVLLAAVAGRTSAAVRAQSPGALFGSTGGDTGESRAPGPNLLLAPVMAGPSAEGMSASPSRSRTTLVSRHARWLRRFFSIFGAALVVAIVFNIYMTRRLDSQAATAGKVPEQLASGSGVAPVDVARALAPSTVGSGTPAPAATTATGLSPGEPPGARSLRGAALSIAAAAPARPQRPAAASTAGAAAGPGAGPDTDRPVEKTRPRASGEGKKALVAARAAFERDDFSRAILEGRAAVAAGEGGAHAILGAAYFKIGRFQDAVREYGEALRLEPDNPALARRVEIARRAASRRAEGASP